MPNRYYVDTGGNGSIYCDLDQASSPEYSEVFSDGSINHFDTQEDLMDSMNDWRGNLTEYSTFLKAVKAAWFTEDRQG